MASVEISDEVYERARAFKQVVDLVVGSEIEFSTHLELVLSQGMAWMLAELVRPALHEVLTDDIALSSMQRLAEFHPREVYRFVSDAIEAGSIARPQVGFALPDDESSSPPAAT